MYCIVHLGNIAVVQLLIEHGANVNEKEKRNINGATPLMLAIELGTTINGKEKTNFYSIFS